MATVNWNNYTFNTHLQGGYYGGDHTISIAGVPITVPATAEVGEVVTSPCGRMTIIQTSPGTWDVIGDLEMVDEHEAAEIREEMEVPEEETMEGAPEEQPVPEDVEDTEGTNPDPRQEGVRIGRTLFTDLADAHTDRLRRTVGTNTTAATDYFNDRDTTSLRYANSGESVSSRVSESMKLKIPMSRSEDTNKLIREARRVDFLERYALMCLTKGVDADFEQANDVFNDALSFMDVETPDD